MQKEEPYVIPELKLVGDTNEVVLGSLGVGFDFLGQHMPAGKEFETDDLSDISSR
jgi:hypothetical protein